MGISSTGPTSRFQLGPNGRVDAPIEDPGITVDSGEIGVGATLNKDALIGKADCDMVATRGWEGCTGATCLACWQSLVGGGCGGGGGGLRPSPGSGGVCVEILHGLELAGGVETTKKKESSIAEHGGSGAYKTAWR